MLKAGFLGIAALAMAAMAGTVGASVLGRPKSGVGRPRRPAQRHRTGSVGILRTHGGAAQGARPRPARPAWPRRRRCHGPVVARVSQLASGRAVAFDDPITGDPGLS